MAVVLGVGGFHRLDGSTAFPASAVICTFLISIVGVGGRAARNMLLPGSA